MKINSDDPQVINISPRAFQQLAEKPLLIDVRFSPEYQAGHAPNAYHLSLPKILMGMSPLFRWLLPQWFQKLNKDQPLAIICFTAHRSPIVAKELVKKGFSHVYNITGGMMEWKKLGLEIAPN
jgi:rhodanese-related sulfurtransferase